MTGPDQRVGIVIGIVIGIAALEACGQTCIKKARLTKENVWKWIIIGGLFYMGVVLLLFMCYKYGGVGHVNLMWSCLSIILAISVGYFLFNEPFNHYTIMAICTAALTIYLAHKADEYADNSK